MIDVGLVARARTACGARQRKYLTVSQLLAVVMQESGGVPYFIDTKPGSIYALNLADAITHKIRDDHGNVIGVVPTGLKADEVRDLIRLPEQINGWSVPRDLVGRMSKFRFEYAYWRRYQSLDKVARFRMSCSWGLGQFMGANVAGKLQQPEAEHYVHKFAADIPLQMLYTAGEMDRLLILADGDLDQAYRGYNSGNIHSLNKSVIARAHNVVARERDIAASLKR
jgi:hypothetical protein